ncbi:MAG: tellurite resistance TerB family protein [Gammaproteobacteria bacterium]|nr:tellurite resistance TerB family protein [Gammaproteobacteria bacterium]
MEFILILVAWWFGWWIFTSILGFGAKGASAAYKTVTKGGTFAENFSNAFVIKIERKEQNLNVISIKGQPSIQYERELALYIKIYDAEERVPVISTFEGSSEFESRIYEQRLRIGQFKAGQYWPNWVELCDFTDQEIIGPKKGQRKLLVSGFLWDINQPANFKYGIAENIAGSVDFAEIEMPYNFINVGYTELDQNRLKVQGLSVQLAIGLAMSDGSLDRKEGNVIKKWMKEAVEIAPESDRAKVKNSLNKALETGSKKAKEGKTNISNICKQLDQKAGIADKYDVLELCLDVMSSDGKADQEELAFIEEISKHIGIDYKEITKLKERRLLDLELPEAETADVDKALDIDPSWSQDEKKKHIMKLYRKYNGRINSAKDENQKKSAQSMLDLCAEAIKKYG